MKETGRPVAILQFQEPPVSKEAGMQGRACAVQQRLHSHTSHAQPQAHG